MATAEGIDNITPGVALPIVEVLQDSAGDPVTSGTTSLAIYEIQDDGSLKSFDFDSNTFTTSSLTTETASLTHRTGNGGATNTGVWTYILSTTQLDGFTEGRKYLIRVTNSGASPPSLVRMFGYGEAPQATTVAIASAAIQAIWDAAVSGLTTAGSIGKRIVDYLTGDAFARLGAPAGASVSADIAAVKAETASILDDTDLIDDATSGLAKIATDVAAILGDTNELQTNQGNWLTATGFSTHSAADVWSVATRVLTANTNLNDPTAGAIADAVWDEALSGHLTSGSTGNALNAAGAAGDPWSTSLPGAYGAGTAGYILGTNIDATVSSRLADGDYTAPPSAASIRSEIDSNSTKLADIVADTNELQTDWANGGRLDLILDARASQSSVDTIGTTTDKLGTMIESDGSGGWEFTAGALANAGDITPGSTTLIAYVSAVGVVGQAASSSGTLTIVRYSDFAALLTGLGSLTSRDDVLFTIKASVDDTDDQALVQVSETGGLLRINGEAAADSTQASLTVTDEATGSVRIELSNEVTAALAASETRPYSLKLIRSNGEAVELTNVDWQSSLTYARIITGITRAVE